MERTTKMGMNKTGVQMSPADLAEMLRSIEQATPAPEGNGAAMAAVRTTFITESDSVGSVPLPGTVKGAVKAGAKKLTGKNPEVFIDKLGERLAFERSGVRLYEALITKYQATPQKVSGMSAEELLHIREEEARHFKLVNDAMETLGADPTAQTPCAAVIGVEGVGLSQVVEDPRTTLAQSLNAILVAELADNAGWELLIELAEQMGQDDMAANFREALSHEQEHLSKVKQWHQQCVLGDAA
jgi:ferritin-like metal-binding protein YciE